MSGGSLAQSLGLMPTSLTGCGRESREGAAWMVMPAPEPLLPVPAGPAAAAPVWPVEAEFDPPGMVVICALPGAEPAPVAWPWPWPGLGVPVWPWPPGVGWPVCAAGPPGFAPLA